MSGGSPYIILCVAVSCNAFFVAIYMLCFGFLYSHFSLDKHHTSGCPMLICDIIYCASIFILCDNYSN